MNDTAQPLENPLDSVKSIIAVGAGKGGVGKSTVAALLAVGLQRAGWNVGLLDGDVYGPSLPKITGTENAQPTADEDGRIFPLESVGVRVMSMGYFVPADEATVWRGPMAQKYVAEFLQRVFWGNLDCLIVDLPPGTGDIPLTLSQTVPLTGAVIVCTPQDVALLDAMKALRMYQKLNVPILGMVENMSYYVCPQCGHRDDIFGHGGAASAAQKAGANFLGEIPLNVGIRANGDAGKLADNFTNADTNVRAALDSLTDALKTAIETQRGKSKPLPQLKIEG